MQEVSVVVARDPESCWRAFIDAATFSAWVPGLRRARVIAVDPDQRPAEILFELGESLTYSLVYTYDAAAREVTWVPGAGKRDAVAGFARFVAEDGGTRITYGVKQGDGRSPAAKELGGVTALADAFVRWMTGG